MSATHGEGSFLDAARVEAAREVWLRWQGTRNPVLLAAAGELGKACAFRLTPDEVATTRASSGLYDSETAFAHADRTGHSTVSHGGGVGGRPGWYCSDPNCPRGSRV